MVQWTSAGTGLGSLGPASSSDSFHLSPYVELGADNHFPVSCMLRRSSICTGKVLTLLLPD